VTTCASHDVWAVVGEKISETLSSITLDQLVKMNQKKEKKLCRIFERQANRCKT
jgi:DNA-binding IscR family transcriptional regulator